MLKIIYYLIAKVYKIYIVTITTYLTRCLNLFQSLLLFPYKIIFNSKIFNKSPIDYINERINYPNKVSIRYKDTLINHRRIKTSHAIDYGFFFFFLFVFLIFSFVFFDMLDSSRGFGTCYEYAQSWDVNETADFTKYNPEFYVYCYEFHKWWEYDYDENYFYGDNMYNYFHPVKIKLRLRYNRRKYLIKWYFHRRVIIERQLRRRRPAWRVFSFSQALRDRALTFKQRQGRRF